MTSLTILPNTDKKTLKLTGKVAAGEHVAVSVSGGADWIGEGKALRLRVLFGMKQVAMFPLVTEEDAAADTSGETVADEWAAGGEGDADAICTLNLFTIPAEKYLKFGGNCLWVLDDVENNTLYGTGELEVLSWPKRRGSDVPYSLDEYPDIVAEMQEAWVAYQATVNAALASHEAAVAAAVATKADATALATETSNRESGDSALGTRVSAVESTTATHTSQISSLQTDVASKADATATSAALLALDSEKADKATTLAGYGITDALISNGTVILGSNSITPLTSHQDISGKADKSTTYTKTEVDAIVQALKTGSREIVETLPASGQPMVIYMVPKFTSQTNNAYDEYIWTAAGAWEKIGDTEIDLSGYYTKTATDTLLAAKQDIISDLSDIRSGAAAGATAYQKPSSGIPASDLAAAVQTSLGKADTALQAHQDISGKADKVVPASAGNFAVLDSDGSLLDSGLVPSDFADASHTHSFADLDAKPTTLAGYGITDARIANGVITLGAATITPLTAHQNISGKADKVSGGTEGNLAAIGTGGNLADSGKALGDFALAVSLAPTFVAGDAYEVGDLCTSFDNDQNHKGTWLYKCKLATDGSQWTPPEIDPTHWEFVTVEDVLAALRTALAGKQDALSAAQIANIAAVPNKADAAALRYDLPTNATAINTASQETVEGETVNYGAATLADRTGNRVSITAALDELRVTFPPAVSGKLRDFGLRVEVGTGSAALTAPALVPVAPTGETIKLENNAKQIPALADGTATAKGVTLLYFSESAPGVFFAKGEQVEEVA